MTGRVRRPLKGDHVGGTVRCQGEPSPAGSDDHVAVLGERLPPNALVYSLISGAAAVLAGAVAGLTVTGVSRFAVWSVVAGVTSVASGLVWDSAAVSSIWSVPRRWGRDSSGSSTSS